MKNAIIRKDLARNIAKIYKCLANAKDWLWLREIARRTNLNHKTVGRILDKYFSHFIDERILETPFRVRLIKLKEGVSLENIYTFIILKEKLKEF